MLALPALYALDQHAALADVSGMLVPGEATYVQGPPASRASLLCPRRCPGPVPESSSTRARPAFGMLRTNLSTIQPQQGGDVWVGAWSSPAERQGLVVLGAYFGSATFSAAATAGTTLPAEHPAAAHPGPQSAWLLRKLPSAYAFPRPLSNTEYAREHDRVVEAWLSTLLYASAAHLPLGLDLVGVPLLPVRTPLSGPLSRTRSPRCLLAFLPKPIISWQA